MKRALIIDDSEFMKNRLTEILKSMDKQIIGHATNGKDGVRLYKELKPDFVFLDINMPQLSGKDALLQIINYDPNAIVIMCSTLGAENVIAECIEDGAQHYILKPFIRKNVEDVVKAVSRF